MRGANCWTDHPLVVSRLKLRLRPPRRACRARPTSFDVEKLQALEVQSVFAEAISKSIPHLDIDTGSLEADWNTLSSHIVYVGTQVLGLKKRFNEDWFDENDEKLAVILERHRNFLRQQNHSRSQCNSLLETIRNSGSTLRKTTREMKDSWWSRKAEYLQWLSDTKQLGTFYAEVRKLVAPKHRSSVPLKSRSGEQRLTAKEDVLKRWAEHFKELLNEVQ
ncbi:unnamed protein product [Parnassius apollo]|uniref:(apollo) hypothetical protein n=1 Tax=Parnassius apollo TaxID=110799 RepID=A0A8S3X245_PARAO|nr:unnamed protein product [Parnassius apollo]